VREIGTASNNARRRTQKLRQAAHRLFEWVGTSLYNAVESWPGGGVDTLRAALTRRGEFSQSWQSDATVHKRHPMVQFIELRPKSPPEEYRVPIIAIRKLGAVALKLGWVTVGDRRRTNCESVDLNSLPRSPARYP
jgi:hypothetical protein